MFVKWNLSLGFLFYTADRKTPGVLCATIWCFVLLICNSWWIYLCYSFDSLKSYLLCVFLYSKVLGANLCLSVDPGSVWVMLNRRIPSMSYSTLRIPSSAKEIRTKSMAGKDFFVLLKGQGMRECRYFFHFFAIVNAADVTKFIWFFDERVTFFWWTRKNQFRWTISRISSSIVCFFFIILIR